MNLRPAAGAEKLDLVDGLVQLSALVQDVFARTAATHDLSVLQARLLGVLRDREPTMAELRHLLDLDKSSTTGLIDRAARADLVERISVPEDGRSYRVRLTTSGRAHIDAFVADITVEVWALTDHLTETNRHRLELLTSSVVTNNAEVRGIDPPVAGARRPHRRSADGKA